MDAIMKAEKTINGELVRLSIFNDEMGESPRDWDNIGTMVCWHSRHNLGDKHDYRDTYYMLLGILDVYEDDDTVKDKDEKQLMEMVQKKALIFPLYLYDHSGITISMSNGYPYNDRWDAGQVGWIYVTFDKIKKEYGKADKKTKEKVEGYLQGEVETYDQYLRGEVYCYALEKVHKQILAHSGVEVEDNEHISSCCGFYGTRKELKDALKDQISEEYHSLIDNLDY